MAYRKTDKVVKKMAGTRARILKSALQLLEGGGWRACTVTSVARLSKLSTGALYTHFGNVTELHCTLYRQIGEEELAVIRAIVEENTMPLDRLERAVGCFAARALRGPVRAYAMMAEPAHPEIEALKQSYHASFIELFQRLLSEALDAGNIPLQPARLGATFLFGAMVETLFYPLSEGEGDFIARDAQLVTDLTNLCFRAIGASRDTDAKGNSGHDFGSARPADAV